MVDRSIVYTAALPRTVDFLNTNKMGMIGLAFAMKGCLGYSGLNYPAPAPPYVEGLQCTPTSPTADLNVHVNIGSIYAIDNVDATAYSDLGTDTNSILKQGILYTPVTLAITPPSTPGYSQIYLVEAILDDIDAGSVVLPYFNAANPSQPYSGPGNNGTSQYTTRTTTCAVALKAGVAASTGSQVAPTPDVGYVALWQVTVANGQTQITSANIALSPIAPFFPTLPSIPAHIQNGDWISADDTGTTNALVIAPFPPIAGLQKYQKFRVKVKNSNTGPATLAVNGFSGGIYILGGNTSGFPSGALLANTYTEFICDGTNFELAAGAVTINNNSYTTGGPTAGLTNVQVFTASGTYIPTTGASKAFVICTGGGSAGDYQSCANAAGGGAGSTAIAFLSLSGVSSVPVTIGAAGVTGAGGQSSFGSYAVAGGGGFPPASAIGGTGGTATTGLLLIRGGDGDCASRYSDAGNGACSFWGGGGEGASADGGLPGKAFGSGGGGSSTHQNAGVAGVVLVMEF